MSTSSNRATFIVQLKDSKNATWQGNVVWAEQNITKHFRSALELIRLMDSVVGEQSENDCEESSENSFDELDEDMTEAV